VSVSMLILTTPWLIASTYSLLDEPLPPWKTVQFN
jgi:hypothetical protein